MRKRMTSPRLGASAKRTAQLQLDSSEARATSRHSKERRSDKAPLPGARGSTTLAAAGSWRRAENKAGRWRREAATKYGERDLRCPMASTNSSAAQAMCQCLPPTEPHESSGAPVNARTERKRARKDSRAEALSGRRAGTRTRPRPIRRTTAESFSRSSAEFRKARRRSARS